MKIIDTLLQGFFCKLLHEESWLDTIYEDFDFDEDPDEEVF